MLKIKYIDKKDPRDIFTHCYWSDMGVLKFKLTPSQKKWYLLTKGYTISDVLKADAEDFDLFMDL